MPARVYKLESLPEDTQLKIQDYAKLSNAQQIVYTRPRKFNLMQQHNVLINVTRPIIITANDKELVLIYGFVDSCKSVIWSMQEI